MLSYVPFAVLALIASIVAFSPCASGDRPPGVQMRNSLWGWCAGALVAVVGFAVFRHVEPLGERLTPSLWAGLLTPLAVMACSWRMGGQGLAYRVVSIGWPALALAWGVVPQKDVLGLSLSVLVASASLCVLGMALFGCERGLDAMLVLFAGATLAFLGSFVQERHEVWSTPLAGALLAGTFAVGLKLEARKVPSAWVTGLGVVLLLPLGYFLATRVVWVGDFALLAAAGVGAAVLAAWMLPEHKRADAFRFVLVAVVFLSLATLAFSLRRGFGMATVGCFAVIAATMIGSRQAVLAASPLLGLGLFRAIREMHPDATRALDIGQHYALIGILLGAMMVMAGFTFAAQSPESALRRLAMGVAVLMAVVLAPVGLIVLLGSKGSVGLLIGLFLGPVLLGMSGHKAMGSWVWTLPMASVLGLALGPLEQAAEWTRTEKLPWVGWLAVAVAALCVVAWLLRGVTPTAPEEAKA